MILISIKPEHCKNIFNGIKTIEWRTKPLPIDRAAVYCTKSGEKLYQNKWTYLADGGIGAPLLSGKVIGEFTVVRNVKYATVDEIPESVITAGCVSKAFLQAYSKGKALYANYIEDVRLYDEPKELGEFYSVKQCKPCESPFGYQWTWEDRHKRNNGGCANRYRPVPIECHRCKSLVGGKDYLDEKSGCILFDYECTSNYHKPLGHAPQSYMHIETPDWVKE